MNAQATLRFVAAAFFAIAAYTGTALAQPAGTQYVGCFKDDRWNRDLAGHTEEHPGMTGQACTDVCRKKGFKYAATQYGKHCFCGNAYGKFGAAANCDMKCAGNPAEICGGSSANSVYSLLAVGGDAGKAGGPVSPVAAATPASQPSGGVVAGVGEYKGCFKDAYPNRDVVGFEQRNAGLTLQWCADTCRQKGFRYAAAQYGAHCFCGNSFGKHGAATNCDMNCAGNRAQICGGSYANSVYDVAAGGTSPLPSPPTPLPPPTAPAAQPKSLTGAWVHSSVGTTPTPDSKVIIIQDGQQVTFVQSYKAEANRNQWQTLSCVGPRVDGQVRLQCKWAPGGDPMGYGSPWSVTFNVSPDGNHLDGIGKDAHHYSRVP